MAIPEPVRVAIIEEYASYGVPADDIATQAKAASEFTARVNIHLPKSQQLTVELCKQTTLKLRKRGEANGGLPRLSGGHGPSPGRKSGHGPQPTPDKSK